MFEEVNKEYDEDPSEVTFHKRGKEVKVENIEGDPFFEEDPVDKLVSEQLQNQVINFEEALEVEEPEYMPKGVSPLANSFFDEAPQMKPSEGLRGKQPRRKKPEIPLPKN